MVKRRNKDKERTLSKERIELLFHQADLAAEEGRLDDANRYVKIARDIGMRYNVRVPGEFKRKFCKHCYRYLLPGVTSKTRINSTQRRIEIRCIKCGKSMYYPYKK